MTDESILDAARRGAEGAFERLVAPYRRELRAHCYRMTGSLQEADDLVQESLLKVWKGLPTFQGRSHFRTWLYRVTTNVCLDALQRREPRTLPKELGPAAGPGDPIGPPRLEAVWLEPCPADLYSSPEPPPDVRYQRRQSVALAFLVAIQALPAKQRAILILHDVLGFRGDECASLLDLSTAAVNSALQRARATLSSLDGALKEIRPTADDTTLLERYVRAWESADVEALVALLCEDATLEMPPLPQWVFGAAAIGASIESMVFAPVGPGAFQLLRTEANGQPAFAAYQLDRHSGEMRAMALHVLRLRDGRIASITAFLNPSLMPAFALPDVLAAGQTFHRADPRSSTFL